VVGRAVGGRLVTVEMLLQKSGIDVNARDSYRRTPMMLAAALGDEALVITLINAGDCVCMCVVCVCHLVSGDRVSVHELFGGDLFWGIMLRLAGENGS
jgi:hypothetical protein